MASEETKRPATLFNVILIIPSRARTSGQSGCGPELQVHAILLQVHNRDNCSGCHGDAGKPSHWGTNAFYPRVPQFDSEPPLKLDWQIFCIVKRGVRYTGMGAWEGEMPEDNIWKVAGF